MISCLHYNLIVGQKPVNIEMNVMPCGPMEEAGVGFEVEREGCQHPPACCDVHADLFHTGKFFS